MNNGANGLQCNSALVILKWKYEQEGEGRGREQGGI